MASYQEALEKFVATKHKESLEIIKQDLVVENDFTPNSPNYNLRFLAAHIHWELNNKYYAIHHFKKCMAISPNRVEPYIDLALYYLELKKYNSAWKTSLKGLKIKKDPLLYALQGEIFLAWRGYKRAKTYFEKANALNPNLDLAYNGLGIALLRLKKYREANTSFIIANEISPQTPEILNNLGISFESLEDLKKAEECYSQALALAPNDLTIKRNSNRIKIK